MSAVWQALYVHCHLILSTTLQGIILYRWKHWGSERSDLGFLSCWLMMGKLGFELFVSQPNLPVPFCLSLLQRDWRWLDLGIQPPAPCCGHGKMQPEFHRPDLQMHLWHVAFLSVEDCSLCQVSMKSKRICLAVVLKLPFQFKSRIIGGCS